MSAYTKIAKNFLTNMILGAKEHLNNIDLDKKLEKNPLYQSSEDLSLREEVSTEAENFYSDTVANFYEVPMAKKEQLDGAELEGSKRESIYESSINRPLPETPVSAKEPLEINPIYDSVPLEIDPIYDSVPLEIDPIYDSIVHTSFPEASVSGKEKLDDLEFEGFENNPIYQPADRPLPEIPVSGEDLYDVVMSPEELANPVKENFYSVPDSVYEEIKTDRQVQAEENFYEIPSKYKLNPNAEISQEAQNEEDPYSIADPSFLQVKNEEGPYSLADPSFLQVKNEDVSSEIPIKDQLDKKAEIFQEVQNEEDPYSIADPSFLQVKNEDVSSEIPIKDQLDKKAEVSQQVQNEEGPSEIPIDPKVKNSESSEKNLNTPDSIGKEDLDQIENIKSDIKNFLSSDNSKGQVSTQVENEISKADDQGRSM